MTTEGQFYARKGEEKIVSKGEHMPSGSDEQRYFDIREAPRSLRQLVEIRMRRYLRKSIYRTLSKHGQMEEILNSEVKRMRNAFRTLAKALRAKGYTDPEAHGLAWRSLVRNWPFPLDDGEPGKKVPADKKVGRCPSIVAVTAKNGRRYVLVYQEPTAEDHKRIVGALQCMQEARKKG
jgi:hypothetical protein